MASSSDIPTVYGGGGPLAHIPDDVTIPQFFLDGHHPLGGEPLLLRKPAWFIDDATGREFTGDQVSAAGFASCISRSCAFMPAPSAGCAQSDCKRHGALIASFLILRSDAFSGFAPLGPCARMGPRERIAYTVEYR